MAAHFHIKRGGNMPNSEVEELRTENKRLKARLANAEKVIQDAGSYLNQGDFSSIWPSSPIHQQIDLYLNPKIVNEEANENEPRQLRA